MGLEGCLDVGNQSLANSPVLHHSDRRKKTEGILLEKKGKSKKNQFVEFNTYELTKRNKEKRKRDGNKSKILALSVHVSFSSLTEK